MTRKNILSGGKKTPAPPADGDDGSVAGSSVLSSGGGAGQNGRRIRVAPDPDADLICSLLPLTDLGNAERWRVRFGRDFRFCAELGWFRWDGQRWHLLSEEKDQVPAEVIWSVTLTVRAIRNEASLVAATGGLSTHIVGDKTIPMLYAWAADVCDRGREAYLKGDHDGAREAWLDGIEPADMVIDFGKRKALSSTIAAWAKTSEGAPTVSKIVKWVKGFADIVARPDQFDQDRLAINVMNGTLRLKRKSVKRSSDEVEAGKSEWKTDGWDVRLDPHRREDLITKLAPVKYSRNAKCPTYDAFIAQVQPDEAMRRFIHQWGGYSLTGDISAHKMAFFHGGGRNGKGTWVELVAFLSGDYAGTVGIESLADSGGKRRGDQATPDIAQLPGVRFLRVSEPPMGMSFNDGFIKQLTGGDPVNARHLNKGFFTFLPSFKITISGNNKPKIKDLTHGMWARMQLVPWTVTIAEDEIDTSLGEKLNAEISGVFNRLIEGLLDWRENGLIQPDAVKNATRAYRDDSDELGRFLRDVCEVGEDPLKVRVKATELFDLYEAWAKASGRDPWKQRGFVGAMRDKGFDQKTSNGVWWVKVQPKPGVTAQSITSGDWGVTPAPEHDLPPDAEPDDGWVPPGWEDD